MAGDAASLPSRLRRATARLIGLIADSRARSQWITKLTARRSLHQDVVDTHADRYPKLFAAARDAAGDRPLSILSFGCSSGEEVVSLRNYFPEARIVGAEINKAMLAQCRQLPVDPGTTFIFSTRDAVADHGPYDAIFCMAVLQRRPHWVASRAVTDIARHYPFALFADEVRFLASQLAPDGLLIVEHSLYRVEDVAGDLGLVPVDGTGSFAARSPRFDPAGKLIAPSPVISRIFRRVSAS